MKKIDYKGEYWNMDMNTYIEKMTHKMIETEEEFIFQSIAPYCDNFTERRITKEELVNALVRYRELEEENEKLKHRVIRLENLLDNDFEMQFVYYWRNHDGMLEDVKLKYYSPDKTIAYCECSDGILIGIPVEKLVSPKDVEDKFMNKGE